MLHTRYSVLKFEPDAQNLAFMLKEAEKDLWGFLRGDGRDHSKEVIEMLLRYEQQEHLELKRYERSGTRKGSRGGYSSITLKTSSGIITIERPRLRKQTYKSKVLPLYTKNESQILDLITNLYLAGISTRKMAKGLESILGVNGISASSVSVITNRIRGKIEEFHRRSLEDKYVFLYLDGLTMTVRGIDGKGRKYLLLVAYGVDYTGVKELIDFTAVRSESEEHWSGFLFDLYERGLKGKRLKLIIVDGGKGLGEALDGIYTRVLRQRCWAHKLRNVATYLRKKDEEECLAGAKAIYSAKSLKHAKKEFRIWKLRWEKLYPEAITCLEKDLDEMLTFFLFDARHWRKLRTTNPIERIFREFRRRTDVMGNHMTNMNSCEKIFYVITEFLNERWRTRRYLHFKEIELIPTNIPTRDAA